MQKAHKHYSGLDPVPNGSWFPGCLPWEFTLDTADILLGDLSLTNLYTQLLRGCQGPSKHEQT